MADQGLGGVLCEHFLSTLTNLQRHMRFIYPHQPAVFSCSISRCAPVLPQHQLGCVHATFYMKAES